MMKLSDFRGVFRTGFATVERVSNPFDDYYTIHLNPPPNTTWHAGQHAVITIPDAQVTGRPFRAFSIASTAEEDTMLIGFRTGEDISSFKDTLIHLPQGARVKVRGPFGHFIIRDDMRPLVFIAQGVGITPFRALMLQMKQQQSRPVELLYVAKDEALFEQELKEMVKDNPLLQMTRISSKETLTPMIHKLATEYGNDATYYISGKPNVIRQIKRALKKEGIRRCHMVHDIFFGY